MEKNIAKPKTLALAFAAFAIATFAAMAIALPQSAWAAPASDQLAAGNAKLSDQAGSKTMWVLTGVKDDYGSTSFTYNAKGLLTKEKSKYQTSTYAYDKKNRLKSSTSKSNGFKATKITYTLNKKGWVVKSKSAGSSTAIKYQYNKNGKFLKMVLPYKTGKSQTITYDKKGNIAKMTSSAAKVTFKYDAKGNATKQTYSYSNKKNVTTFKNTYDKNGLLVKSVHKSSGYKTTETYTYKQITVPKAAQKMVKSQQWTLLQQRTHNGWPSIITAHA